ncbi:Ig-like domain-containing protein [Pseudomonadota bacterium]
MKKSVLLTVVSVIGLMIGLPGISVSQGISVSSVLTPFDATKQDLLGPGDWYANYGKKPEIIVSSNGVELDVFAQDYDAATDWSSVLLHVKPSATGGYEVTQTLTNMPMLDRVMGLAVDASGNRYYATGVDENSQVNATYPPLDTYRNDIVRVVKLNPAGDVQFNIDLDTARYAYNNGAEMIINPMTAGSARLAVGGNEIGLVHSINTDPDPNISNRRHQKALSTRLDATSGAITRTSSIWVSHSFDQRLLHDGTGIIEYHLGDAYPRTLAFGRNHISYPLFHIKGELGENLVATALGNIALIENDPDYGYIALFSTESSTVAGTMYNPINGPRNLAIVRVNHSDNSIDPTLPDSLTVTSSGKQKINRLKWITHYTDNDHLHAERPKLIGIGADRYIALWEQWYRNGSTKTFNGVYGIVIDDAGEIAQGPALITDQYHLSRGDDAFFLDSRAAWMTGSQVDKALYIHFVDASLNYQKIEVGDANVSIPNASPILMIDAPTDGRSFMQGSNITFSASANDAEDGNLSRDITWSSSLDGNLGTGASFSVATLSTGTHIITASVTDSRNITASSTLTLSVSTSTGDDSVEANPSAADNGSSSGDGSSGGGGSLSLFALLFIVTCTAFRFVSRQPYNANTD